MNEMQSIVRSHVWLQALQDGTYESIEVLAEAHRLHPKVARLALRLPFLSPDLTVAIMVGSPVIKIATLATIPKSLPFSGARQQHTLIMLLSA